MRRQQHVSSSPVLSKTSVCPSVCPVLSMPSAAVLSRGCRGLLEGFAGRHIRQTQRRQGSGVVAPYAWRWRYPNMGNAASVVTAAGGGMSRGEKAARQRAPRARRGAATRPGVRARLPEPSRTPVPAQRREGTCPARVTRRCPGVAPAMSNLPLRKRCVWR